MTKEELEKENAELKSKVEELKKRGKQNYEHYMMAREELSGKIKDWEDTCKSYCEDLDTAKKIVGSFFKHCSRVDLVTYMGEGNVIKAEQFLEEK